MRVLLFLLLCSPCRSGEVSIISINNTYVSSHTNNVVSMLKKINHGTRIIHDMCESLEEKYSYIRGSNKPSCRYNVSYLRNTEIILSKIGEPIRTFLISEKKTMCENEKIECGSLSIMIKILDLINIAIEVAISGTNIDVNMDLIEFDVMFDVYTQSLDNNELLTNITLSRTKANLILQNEKEKILNQISRRGVWKFGHTLSIYIAEPIKNVFVYTGNMIGSTLGSTIGSTIDGVSPSVSIGYENKIIIGLLSILIFLKR